MNEWYERPKPSHELNKLDIFMGKWVSTDIHQPMPWMKNGGTGISKEIFRKALDGYCFISDIQAETPFGNLKGHGFTFYDSVINKYKFEWYDNFGNHITGEGQLTDNNTYVLIENYIMNGQRVTERHTDKLINEKQKLHTIETLVDGEFKLTSELNYKKEK